MSRESMPAAFLLLVHDEFSGRPRCSADLLRCGLVGAQLAELVIGGRVGVADGRLHPLDADPIGNSRPAPEYVMECVLGQPRQHTVRTWTENLGEPLHEMIVTELVDDGIIRRESGGFGRRRAERYPALNLLRAAAPKARIERMITAPRELDLAGAFTIAMIWALGIEAVLDTRAERGGADLVERIRARMPGPLRDLLDGIASSAAATSLTVRR
jgi:Golgi phosphoprotein 3 (GPP34)